MLLDELAAELKRLNIKLCTVESCTGGGIAAKCTDLPGSSSWFLGGFVTYANSMKLHLGVKQTSLDKHGAVSEQVAIEMAKAGLSASGADWSIAVTGVAGPDGGSLDKPVGTVWFAWASKKQTFSKKCLFSGSRRDIRRQAIDFGLAGLFTNLK